MTPYIRELLTYIIVFQGLILIVLLSKRKSNYKANLFLASYLIILIILITWKTFRSESLVQSFPYLFYAPYTLWFIIHPIQYLYVKSLLEKSLKFSPKLCLHLIPFGIGFIMSSSYIFMDLENKLTIINNNSIVLVDQNFDFINALFSLSVGFFYAIGSYLLLLKYDLKILSKYSNIESINLKWLNTLVIFLILANALSIVAEFLYFYKIEKFDYLYDISFYAFIVLVYVISYKMISQPQIFTRINLSETTDNTSESIASFNIRYTKSKLQDHVLSQYLEQLQRYMIEEKPYLDCDLNIDQVSKAIDVSKHHLSQVLNIGLNKNFYTFVNEYRVKTTIELLKKGMHKEYSMYGIALESGFNSKASFNRIFKSITKKTPSQYLDLISKNK